MVQSDWEKEGISERIDQRWQETSRHARQGEERFAPLDNLLKSFDFLDRGSRR